MTTNIPSPSESADSIQWPAPFSKEEWFAIMASVAFAGATAQELTVDPDDPHIGYVLAVCGMVSIRRTLGDAAYMELKHMFDERAEEEKAANDAAAKGTQPE